MLLSLSLLSSLAMPLMAENKNVEVSKPDVLFLFVDDMTYNGLNELGTSDVISPNLDRLIQSGVSFQNCYNMGGWNGAISTASRSQLMTGMYLWNTNKAMKTDKYHNLVENQTLWPQVMKNAGYKTFHTGKWHMSYVRAEEVYDEAVAVRPGMPNTVESAYNRPISKNDNKWVPWDQKNGGYWENGKHWSEILADLTIDYMKRNEDSKEPLFMCCAFNAPHDPRQSPKKFIDMYDVDKIQVPESFLPQHPYMDEMKCGKDLRDEQLAPWPRTKFAIQKHRQEYYALITHLDVQIGRILEQLKKSGREKNTLIVFAADNGLALGNHGLVGKQSMYDHSMKIPLAFAGLNLPKGQKRSQLVYLQDLVPTIYEILGIQTPNNVQFVSQLNVVKKSTTKANRQAVYGAYLNKQRMIRKGDYKLFFIVSSGRAMLFDLKHDPNEMNNLFGKSKKYNKIAKELAADYLKLAKEAGDKLDIRSKFPTLF